MKEIPFMALLPFMVPYGYSKRRARLEEFDIKIHCAIIKIVLSFSGFS